MQKNKNERRGRLTDLEWFKSPAKTPKYLLNIHNHPRTSKSCRQNINFWLIHSRHSNVRNYIFPWQIQFFFLLLIVSLTMWAVGGYVVK